MRWIFTAEIVGAELGAHVAAAAPALVADGQEGDLPGFVAAVGAAEIGHGRIGGRGHVLDPLHRFLDGAAADVEADVGLDAEQLAQIEKLVGAEVVVFDDATPVGVEHGGALGAVADAIHPVVLVGEAAARPAQLRHAEILEGGEHVVAVAFGVGDGRVGADPDALVDAVAEVLGELAVDVFVDDGTGRGGVEA